MRAVGLRTLKSKLRQYVRLVAGGETVLVTDRDRVVAELVPPRVDRSLLVSDAMLADAVCRRWIAHPLVTAGSIPPRKPITTLQSLMEELRHDRNDR